MIATGFLAQLPCDNRCLRCASDGLQTATALSQLYIFTRRTPHMNVITNLLAGLVHFVGWLV
ncbi:hypothetical protein [Streptomyces niveus]|uniref:hypothetical protein n=1 Tax=Streptomyces niveus TaxID=193462 RepID=UPI0003C596E5|nr:hypothetical protein [Streptomyces niveus]EST19398.1 hypothetical protein M877_36275 [Streptomyces niveus NCIMB 11891]